MRLHRDQLGDRLLLGHSGRLVRDVQKGPVTRSTVIMKGGRATWSSVCEAKVFTQGRYYQT